MINSQSFARLRAARLLATVAIGFSFAGCRTGQRFGSMVQVTEDPSLVVADIPAPEQRLATSAKTKPTLRDPIVGVPVAGMPKVFQKKQTSASVASNPKSTVSSAQSVATTDTSTEQVKPASAITETLSSSDTIPVAMRISGGKDSNSNSDSNNAVVQRAPDPSLPHVDDDDSPPVATDDIGVTSDGLVSASLTDISPTQKIAKRQPASASADRAPIASTPKADSAPLPPPTETPQSQALVASKNTARPPVRRSTVQATAQPHALTSALKQSLASLPSLPESDLDENGKTQAGVGTARIPLTGDSPNSPKALNSQNAAFAHVGDDVAAKPVAAIDAIEPAEISNQNQVQRMLQASDETNIDADNIDPEPPTTSDRADKATGGLSEAELYGQLLTKLMTPAANENAAERERRQIIARHLMVLAGEPESAVESIEGMNETEQRYLKNQLQGLWMMIDPSGHPSSGRRISAALPKYREAARYMAAATDSLALNNLEFCTEIESYGQIKPFDGNRFSAGQQVIMYCEIDNFASAEKDGLFQTQLRGSYDIYDAEGKKIVSQLLPEDKQQSRIQLRDYFVAYQMGLPPGLSSGTYRLELTIEDAVSNKYGQANIPFEIK